MKNCFVGVALGVWMGIVSAGALAADCKLLQEINSSPPSAHGVNTQDEANREVAGCKEDELASAIAQKVMDGDPKSGNLAQLAAVFGTTAETVHLSRSVVRADFLSDLIKDLGQLPTFPNLSDASKKLEGGDFQNVVNEIRQAIATYKRPPAGSGAGATQTTGQAGTGALSTKQPGPTPGQGQPGGQGQLSTDLANPISNPGASGKEAGTGKSAPSGVEANPWQALALLGVQLLLLLGAIFLVYLLLRSSQKSFEERLDAKFQREQSDRARLEQKLNELDRKLSQPSSAPTTPTPLSPPDRMVSNILPGGGPLGPGAPPGPPGGPASSLDAGRQVLLPVPRSPASGADTRELREDLENIRETLAQVQQEVGTLRSKVDRLQRSVGVFEPGPDGQSLAGLVRGLRASLGQQETRLKRVEDAAASARQAQPPAAPELSWADLAAFERDCLRSSWERYQQTELRAADLAERLKDPQDPQLKLIRELLTTLPKAAARDESLKRACDLLLEPVRDFNLLFLRIKRIPELVRDAHSEESPREDVVTLRESLALLEALRNSQGSRERLVFDLKKWGREQFVGFADLFLRVYQQARFDGAGASWEDGYAVVCRVLGVAGLEPIPVELGQTRFDSSQHIGRSTVTRPGMPDGTIAGVVKNGFRQVGGQVVQQPEVIVNRA